MGRRGVSRGRLAAVLRGLRLDRNPLRRTTDRIETAVLAALVAAFLAGSTLAVLAGVGLAAAGQRAARTDWHQIGAVVLRTAPSRAHAMFQPALDPRVLVQWKAPSGATRAGEAYVPQGTRAGQVVPVWLNRQGRLVPAPVLGAGLVIRPVLQVLLSVSLLAAGLAGLGWTVRLLLNRRRLAAWDLGWSATGPQWTGRR